MSANTHWLKWLKGSSIPFLSDFVYTIMFSTSFSPNSAFTLEAHTGTARRCLLDRGSASSQACFRGSYGVIVLSNFRVHQQSHKKRVSRPVAHSDFVVISAKW